MRHAFDVMSMLERRLAVAEGWMMYRWLPGILMITMVFPAVVFTASCAHVDQRQMEVTAYDPGPESCGWRRGRLLFWRKYVAEGPRKGERYTGKTASGTKPKQVRPGLLSWDSAQRPWMILPRIVFFWNILPRKGTIAADTRYYPFGTKMFVPGYGWGVVEDRGGAIKGPRRIDIYFDSKRRALQWGRQNLKVKVVLPPFSS